MYLLPTHVLATRLRHTRHKPTPLSQVTHPPEPRIRNPAPRRFPAATTLRLRPWRAPSGDYKGGRPQQKLQSFRADLKCVLPIKGVLLERLVLALRVLPPC